MHDRILEATDINMPWTVDLRDFRSELVSAKRRAEALGEAIAGKMNKSTYSQCYYLDFLDALQVRSTTQLPARH
jgi:hypothetical protein